MFLVDGFMVLLEIIIEINQQEGFCSRFFGRNSLVFPENLVFFYFRRSPIVVNELKVRGNLFLNFCNAFFLGAPCTWYCTTDRGPFHFVASHSRVKLRVRKQGLILLKD